MERRRFSQTMASEWQTAFVVSHKMPWCALLTAVKNCNTSLEKLQDFFFKTETKTKFKTKTKTFIFVLEAPRDQDPGTLVSRTTSLYKSDTDTEADFYRVSVIMPMHAQRDARSYCFYQFRLSVCLMPVPQTW